MPAFIVAHVAATKDGHCRLFNEQQHFLAKPNERNEPAFAYRTCASRRRASQPPIIILLLLLSTGLEYRRQGPLTNKGYWMKIRIRRRRRAKQNERFSQSFKAKRIVGFTSIFRKIKAKFLYHYWLLLRTIIIMFWYYLYAVTGLLAFISGKTAEVFPLYYWLSRWVTPTYFMPSSSSIRATGGHYDDGH